VPTPVSAPPPASPDPARPRLEPAGADIVGLRAANPGPLSLSGTNTWLVGRGPAWLVDPGPALPEHLDALDAELGRRGGLGGIAVTHDHIDHAEALAEMRARHPGVPVAAARGAVDIHAGDGTRVGPLEVMAAPGHAQDHLIFIAGDAALTGDAVLGEGSVFLTPDPGALRLYLDALERLRGRDLRVLCPGHGPLITDPRAKLTEYIAHRRDRERRLMAALAEGRRSVDELLDAAWSDAPAQLRAAAAVTLAAHLDKLAEEGRLPAGVERPPPPAWAGSG
jgi:glyoxylase-like metal-dependent hydrolase (beta-lactamase superfamily II)